MVVERQDVDTKVSLTLCTLELQEDGECGGAGGWRPAGLSVRVEAGDSAAELAAKIHSKTGITGRMRIATEDRVLPADAILAHEGVRVGASLFCVVGS